MNLKDFKYIVKCENCEEKYEDVNFQTQYKDSVVRRISYALIQVLRSCPYCDHCKTSLVNTPNGR